MKHFIKKSLAALAAAATMAVSMGSITASAETEWGVRSTGGSHGVMYYNLTTNGLTSRNGIDFFYLQATSKQVGVSDSASLPVSAISYTACIYLASGGSNTSSGSVSSDDLAKGTVNGSFTSNKVAESAVTTETEKGYVLHYINSDYYGYIIRTVVAK